MVRVRGSTGNIGGGSVGRTGEDEHIWHMTNSDGMVGEDDSCEDGLA